MNLRLDSNELIEWLEKKSSSLDLLGYVERFDGGTMDWFGHIPGIVEETEEQVDMMGKYGNVCPYFGGAENKPWQGHRDD